MLELKQAHQRLAYCKLVIFADTCVAAAVSRAKLLLLDPIVGAELPLELNLSSLALRAAIDIGLTELSRMRSHQTAAHTPSFADDLSAMDDGPAFHNGSCTGFQQSRVGRGRSGSPKLAQTPCKDFVHNARKLRCRCLLSISMASRSEMERGRVCTRVVTKKLLKKGRKVTKADDVG